MTEDTPEGPDVPNLRYLKWLVTILTVTMIGGVLTIVALLVIRLGESDITLPDAITLPSGEKAVAFTQTEGWYAVVTQNQEILIFSRTTGEIAQRIQINAD